MKTTNRWIGAAAFVLVMFGAGGRVMLAQQSKEVIKESLTQVGDLSTAQLVEVRDKTGQVLLHGTFATKDNSLKETGRKAKLVSPGGQGAKGEIEIGITRKDGGVSKNKIDLDVENLPAMLDCGVFIDGRSVGTFVTSKKGKGDLQVDWKPDNIK
jgi:hypothetical protein